MKSKALAQKKTSFLVGITFIIGFAALFYFAMHGDLDPAIDKVTQFGSESASLFAVSATGAAADLEGEGSGVDDSSESDDSSAEGDEALSATENARQNTLGYRNVPGSPTITIEESEFALVYSQGNQFYTLTEGGVLIEYDDANAEERISLGGTDATVAYELNTEAGRVEYESVSVDGVDLHLTQEQWNALERQVQEGQVLNVESSSRGENPVITLSVDEFGTSIYEYYREIGTEPDEEGELPVIESRETRSEEGRITYQRFQRGNDITETTYTELYFNAETGELIGESFDPELSPDVTAVSYNVPETTIIDDGRPLAHIRAISANDEGRIELQGQGFTQPNVDSQTSERLGDDSFMQFAGYYDDASQEQVLYSVMIEGGGSGTIGGLFGAESGIFSGPQTITYQVRTISGDSTVSEPTALTQDEFKEALIDLGLTQAEADEAIDTLIRRADNQRQRTKTKAFVRNLNQFGGLAGLSSLFIDDESLANWRETVDEWFATFYLGTEYWSSAICASRIEVAQDDAAFIETPNGLFQSAASVKGEKIPQPSSIEGEGTNIYKITYFVRNQRSSSQRIELATEDIDIQVVLRPGDIEIVDETVDANEAVTRGRDNPIIIEDEGDFDEVCIVIDGQFFILDDNLRTITVDEICDEFEIGSGDPVGFDDDDDESDEDSDDDSDDSLTILN